MLETLDYTIRIGSTPTFLYFDLYEIYFHLKERLKLYMIFTGLTYFTPVLRYFDLFDI